MSKKYKTYKEIQKSFGERNHNNFDYYDNHNVGVIHLKFGKARKLYTGLKIENNIPQVFIDEYEKYWDGKGEMFKNAKEIVDYIVNNDIPIILYANFIDEELNKEEVYKWLGMNKIKE